MENVTTQSKENLQVANFDPAITYANASNLQLSESEAKKIAAPFDELDYEITPAGFIYLPQALSLKRLNDVIGVGRWGLLLINVGQQEIKQGLTKIFYDGALVIRNCFVSRAAGEAAYSLNNANQSYATALEAAKTDCRQRCCKDLGIATDAWNPSYVRAWQKKHAIRVYVLKDNKKEVIWRRRDLDPFYNEVGIVADKPNVPQQKAPENTGTELPWLNAPGAEYDNALQQLLDGKTIGTLKKQFRISKATVDIMEAVLKTEWNTRLATCKTKESLTKSWEDNKAEIAEYTWLKELFFKRREELKAAA